MDFTFTDDQRNLRDAMRDFLAVETRAELQRQRWETTEGRSEELWQKFAAQGLTVNGQGLPASASTKP